MFTKYVKLFENSQSDFKAGDIVTLSGRATRMNNIPILYKTGAKRERAWKEGRIYPKTVPKIHLEVVLDNSVPEFWAANYSIICKTAVDIKGEPSMKAGYLIAFPSSVIRKLEEDFILRRLCKEIENKSDLKFKSIEKNRATLEFFAITSINTDNGILENMGYFSRESVDKLIDFFEKNPMMSSDKREVVKWLPYSSPITDLTVEDLIEIIDQLKIDIDIEQIKIDARGENLGDKTGII